MNKTEKAIFYIAITLILGSVLLMYFIPGAPLFIPAGIGCLLLHLLRTEVAVRLEAKRKRFKSRLKGVSITRGKFK